MILFPELIQVVSFPTTDTQVAALAWSEDPQCQSPKCGPTATPDLCPETVAAVE